MLSVMRKKARLFTGPLLLGFGFRYPFKLTVEGFF